MKKEIFEQKFLSLQPQVFMLLAKNILKQQLSHAYLFVGESGVGKHTLAKWLAKGRFCEAVDEKRRPCLVCHQCVRIEEEINPDVLFVYEKGKNITVEQIRTLKKELSCSGFESEKKVVIIQASDKMNQSSQNSLLKFLEEPNDGVLIILEVVAAARLLPTIISRMQVLNFRKLPAKELMNHLLNCKIKKDMAHLLSDLTNNFEEAVSLSQNEEFLNLLFLVKKWFYLLEKRDTYAFIYVGSSLVPVIKKRANQELALELLRVFWQQKMKMIIKNNEKISALTYAQGLEKILEAKKKFQSNVNFQNVSEQLVLKLMS
ncbi:MAG: sigma 54-interacting transcriptional regulator [Streptococcaceae bacterium]|jgi:DNA polymerase-3 subunit delta'|nr:sigma 54-interacting transcriptional regulator [Streptococcaceae bacterium]